MFRRFGIGVKSVVVVYWNICGNLHPCATHTYQRPFIRRKHHPPCQARYRPGFQSWRGQSPAPPQLHSKYQGCGAGSAWIRIFFLRIRIRIYFKNKCRSGSKTVHFHWKWTVFVPDPHFFADPDPHFLNKILSFWSIFRGAGSGSGSIYLDPAGSGSAKKIRIRNPEFISSIMAFVKVIGQIVNQGCRSVFFLLIWIQLDPNIWIRIRIRIQLL